MASFENYRLPPGPVAIQFSGGRTSGFMLRHIFEAHGGRLPDDCHVLFQNTGREMPETLRFVEECGERWGVEIVWLEYEADEETGGHSWRRVGPGANRAASVNGEPFEAIIASRKFLPNPVMRFCTSELKVRPAMRYMKWRGHERYTAVLGIRADEAHRAKPSREAGHSLHYPMIADGITKRDVAEWWRAQPFDLQLPNANGSTPLGNCDGCFLKSERNRAALAREHPERAAWWAKMERRVGGQFLRASRGEMSWAQLIDHVERQPDWVFDAEAADVYCDADLGSCETDMEDAA